MHPCAAGLRALLSCLANAVNGRRILRVLDITADISRYDGQFYSDQPQTPSSASSAIRRQRAAETGGGYEEVVGAVPGNNGRPEKCSGLLGSEPVPAVVEVLLLRR
ncbi:hypothetical protein ON010_g4070 [Phytophthora cinnamomi]|nr:hypothetical protein ON010_g4070 [Phytophthora cinnamomi]